MQNWTKEIQASLAGDENRRERSGLKLYVGRGVEGVVEGLVGSIRRGVVVVLHGSPAIIAEVVSERPINVLAVMSKPDTAQLQI